MQIVYRGGPRGVHLLAQELRANGVNAVYTAPEEQRGVAETAVAYVVFRIAFGSVEDAARDAVRKGARKAIVKLKEKMPNAEAELRED